MHPDKFDSLPVKTLDAHNVVVDTEHLDAGYTLHTDPLNPATKTGLVTLFRIVPNDAALPGFAGRWDRQQNTVDVDIDPNPQGCIDRTVWQSERKGYSGHHTQVISKDPRAYQIDLRTPSTHIFKGRCSLNIKQGVQIAAELFPSASPSKW